MQPLLWAGVAGAVLFVGAFLVEGLTRRDYNPFRQPVSALALGPGGWVQQVNFVATGILMLLLAAGLGVALRPLGGSPLAPVLVGIYAAGLILAGLFVTDPVPGYPPDPPAAPTRHGHLHTVSSLFVFLPLVAAAIVVGRLLAAGGSPAWAAYSFLSAVAVAAGMVLSGAGFGGAPRLAPVAGIVQRATIIAGWGWLAFLALHLLGVVG